MTSDVHGVRGVALEHTLFLEADGVLDEARSGDLLLAFLREFRGQRLVVVGLGGADSVTETGLAVVGDIRRRTVASGCEFLLGDVPGWIAEMVDTAPAGQLPHEVAERIRSAAPDAAGRGAGWYEHWGKRAVDVVVAALLLVLGLPVILAVWATLRVSLGPDVVISQDRVGRSGASFAMLKFRTMRWSRRSRQVAFLGEDRRRSHKVDTDPRHTPVGRFLRSISADELPQLVNVLLGSMSLVGPRPELASVVDRYGERAHRRHTVRPGITGEWQITGRSAGRLLEHSFDDDLPYLDRITLRNDLRIMVGTIGVVVARRGR